MTAPAALVNYRAECARAIDTRTLVLAGDRIECPGCHKLAPVLYQIELNDKPLGLRCTACAKRALKRLHL